MTDGDTHETETLQIQGHKPGHLLVERRYERDLGSGTEAKYEREWLPVDVVHAAIDRAPLPSEIHTRDISVEGVDLLRRESERLTIEVPA